MNELIWWTTQLDCESTSDERIKSLPRYIREEFEARKGRSGRGRLWKPNRCETKSIEWNYNSPVSGVCMESGGIVIHRRDLPSIKSLAGVVTDLKLNRI